jgi:prolipoprotein diacylglyceryltransferase
MSANQGFTVGTFAAIAAVLLFGLKILPRENMQILASIPIRRRADGLWHGVNLTWYGVMQALAMVFAVGLGLTLAVAAEVQAPEIALVALVLIAIALPSARLLAFVVERRKGTLTVGGAIFVATLAMPWVALGADAYFGSGHALPIVAALATGYAVGEGIGRLACISFGCCYGRRLAESPRWLQRAFARWPAIVKGPTRKAAYASGCEGVPLLPVPAMSAVLLSCAGAAAMMLFLAGSYRAATLVALGVAFSWRFASEFLRADYRGQGRLSAYQWMALACLVYMVPVALLLAPCRRGPDVMRGLFLLTSPVAALALLGLGVAVFGYLGISTVTSATIELQVAGVAASEERARRETGTIL